LQRTIGNQALQRVLKTDAQELEAGSTGAASPRFGHDLSPIPIRPPVGGAIQTKLFINKPGDEYEQEADRVSERMMRMSEPHLQRACACGDHTTAGGECSECSKKKLLGLRTKLKVNEPGDTYEREADRVVDQVMATPAHPAVNGPSPRIQRFTEQPTGQTGTVPTSVDQTLASPGRALEPALRQDMEQRFGYDFSRVRVHSDAAAEQSARDVNANAYTIGHDIVFGAGRFAPGTHEGRRLLAHELTHVVQQSGSEGISFDQSDEKRGLSSISSPLIVQRQRANYHAGGCATCLSASAAGSAAHPFAQGLFVAAYGKEIISEAPIYNPHDDNGRLDLFRIDRFSIPKIIEYGEIKPDNDNGVKQGRADLAWYGEQLSRIFRPPEWLVSRLDVAAPQGAVLFKDNTFPGCPVQVLSVRSTRPIGHEPGSTSTNAIRLAASPVRGSPHAAGSDRNRSPTPPTPPFVGDPRIDWRGDPKTESERGSKGDGRPGKRNGVRAPGRPSTSGGPQPTLRLPGGIDWEAVRNVLIAIAAIAALHPLGRLGNVLGIALGKLLLRLGISLGILGGTLAASPAGSPSIVGGPPSGLPAGTTVPPTGTTIPPVGTTIPPARPTVPPVGTSLPPRRTTVPPAPRVTVPPSQQRPPAASVPQLKVPAKRQTIRLSVIEGLNLETVSVGRFSVVILDPGGRMRN
jgi:hypothetical protein